MFAALLAPLLKYLTDDVISGIFNLISGEIQKRGLILKGQQMQHSADLQASVQEGTDAAKTTEQVNASTDSQLDTGLERVRRDAASGNG